MGLDINLFRPEKGGNPDLVRKSIEARHKDPKIVDEIMAIDEEWRKKRYICDQLRKEYNVANKAVADKKKADKNDPATEEVAKVQQIAANIKTAEEEEAPILNKLNALVGTIGNLVHESVPPGVDETKNPTYREWGIPNPNIKVADKGKLGAAHHHEILYMIDGIEQKKGQYAAGHRGYYLKGFGALLNMALINYGMQFLVKKDYTPYQPPYFLKKSIMEKTCQISDFKENLYALPADKKEDEDKFLIATSEQPLSALYAGDWIEPKDLPHKLAGFSTCFRKEAGAHGKETWGTFRVHQFEKIEQFIYADPAKSWDMLEELLGTAEEFYQSLGLPYKVITIVAGALNDAAAKKYDLEAWFPGYGEYKELVSCSNCTDYQARALEIRYGSKKNAKDEKRYCHLLNSTLVATQRTMCCILENYQTEKGVEVPKPLIPFVGTEFIPYKKPMPKASDLGDAK